MRSHSRRRPRAPKDRHVARLEKRLQSVDQRGEPRTDRGRLDGIDPESWLGARHAGILTARRGLPEHEEDDHMADVIAATFDGSDEAEATLRTIRGLESADKVKPSDTAVVRKDADGKVTIHNEAGSGTEAGAVVGAVLGGVLFVVFPAGRDRGGAAIGGLIGRAASPGIDGKWVKEVGDDLPAGGSALFLQIRGGEAGLVLGAFVSTKAGVFQTTLPDKE